MLGSEGNGMRKKSKGTLRQNCKNTLEGANKLAECICGWRDNIGGDVEKLINFDK